MNELNAKTLERIQWYNLICICTIVRAAIIENESKPSDFTLITLLLH